MRFGVAHKVATYILVGSAFLALSLGGGVSPIISIVAAICLISSWWWEPPFITFERWAVAWAIGSVLVLGYSIVSAIATGDLLSSGAEFLIWLTIAKACHRKAARDWLQLYLLSFLMLIAGSVLNADLTFGVCFLLFVISSTWALTLLHLRREMEDASDEATSRMMNSRRVVSRRFFVGTGALSLVVFLISALFFLAIPRVGMGFFFKSRASVAMTGFSDGVRLGGHGTLKTDTTIVMRVELPRSFGGRGAPEIHWRGVAFDQYSHGEWSRSRLAPTSSYDVVTPRTGRQRRTLTRRTGVRSSDLIEQQIWLEPLDSNVLFGASMLDQIELDVPPRDLPRVNERNDEMRFDHGSAIHYAAWSDLSDPNPELLRHASEKLPPNFAVYLQLPSEITERTRGLAQQITAGAHNNYDKASAIVDWLKKNLTYTLELKEPGKQEPIDFFLFDRKRGHCEYFASAFAVLARSVGIPTRNVNGFLGGEWNDQGYVAIRAGDAHSWAEVFFPGTGWVTFDATPASEDVLGRGSDGALDRMHRFFDTLRFQWTKWVIDYDLGQQLSLLRGVGSAFKDGALGFKHAAASLKHWLVQHWPWIVGGVALATLLIFSLVRYRRRRRAGNDDHRRRSATAAAYLAALEHYARHGHLRSAATTPREFAAVVAARDLPGATAFAELTTLHYAIEFGGLLDSGSLAHCHALERTIADAWRAADRAQPH